MVHADAFDDGVVAYERSDYATLLRPSRLATAQGDAEAAKWYQMAAEQGDSGAQYNLGVMYRDGRGVPQDYAEAGEWFLKAAEQGIAAAQFNIGVMYAGGEGVPQNHTEAVEWFYLVAEQGYGSAQFTLGLMYGIGKGVPKDNVPVHMWLTLAAAQGHEKAQKSREIAAKRMTPDQIAEAQRMAREWMEKHQQ